MLGSQIHLKEKVLFVQHSQAPLVCTIASGGRYAECILSLHCDGILHFTIEEELLSSLHLLALPSSPSQSFKAADNDEDMTSSLFESDIELLRKVHELILLLSTGYKICECVLSTATRVRSSIFFTILTTAD